MGWFLKALFAVVLIVFAIDAKSWIGRVWGIAMDEPKSRWSEIVEGREVLYGQAVALAAEKAVAIASAEPQKLTLGKWFVNEGEEVKERQQLCELVGIRYTLVVAAPCDGIVETAYGPLGLAITDGTVVARIRPSSSAGLNGGQPEMVAVKAVRPAQEFESPIPIAILPMADDVQRRATAALEAAFLKQEWRVQARAAFLDAMEEQDLRALVEKLWRRVSPLDLYTKQGVDRLVYGRVESVAFPTEERCDVRISIRGTRKDGELLFAVDAEGSAGPEPSFQGWMQEHPWRVAGFMLLAAWLALALFTRGKVVPYVERAREEQFAKESTEEGRRVSARAQQVIGDLRRLREQAVVGGRPVIARQLSTVVDQLDQASQALVKASTQQQRRLADSDHASDELLSRIAKRVADYPSRGDEVAMQVAVDEIDAAVNEFRRVIHAKSNT